MRPITWLAIGWMALILWLSSDAGSVERTGRFLLPVLRLLFPAASAIQLDALHVLVRKGGHVTEYAVLVGLWFCALTRDHGMARHRSAWLAWLIAAGWAVIDERYQSTVASRTSSPYDVILDAAGALGMALPCGLGWRRAIDSATRGALWASAVGGFALIVLNLWTGVDVGTLWVSVPVAILALVFLRRPRCGVSRD